MEIQTVAGSWMEIQTVAGSCNGNTNSCRQFYEEYRRFQTELSWKYKRFQADVSRIQTISNRVGIEIKIISGSCFKNTGGFRQNRHGNTNNFKHLSQEYIVIIKVQTISGSCMRNTDSFRQSRHGNTNDFRQLSQEYRRFQTELSCKYKLFQAVVSNIQAVSVRVVMEI